MSRLPSFSAEKTLYKTRIFYARNSTSTGHNVAHVKPQLIVPMYMPFTVYTKVCHSTAEDYVCGSTEEGPMMCPGYPRTECWTESRTTLYGW